MMNEMNEKIAIVNELVSNGYHLFGETVESFASRNSLEMLKNARVGFYNYIGKNI